MMIIDPPSPFAPLSDWCEFLGDMEASQATYPSDPDIAEHVRLAREMVADKP